MKRIVILVAVLAVTVALVLDAVVWKMHKFTSVDYVMFVIAIVAGILMALQGRNK